MRRNLELSRSDMVYSKNSGSSIVIGGSSRCRNALPRTGSFFFSLRAGIIAMAVARPVSALLTQQQHPLPRLLDFLAHVVLAHPQAKPVHVKAERERCHEHGHHHKKTHTHRILL